ncbi:hypothetical protein LCGC14_2473970 [marine sediment metagenome]|uniref:Uncharacterized protein n=1 Tax=marine sediment metagenome TaxID=412755 RepID=A0A0F9BA96_9ZZZZ
MSPVRQSHRTTPRGVVEPMRRNADLVPLTEFRPGLRLKLISSASGNNTLGERSRVKDKLYEPGHENGLADAMTALRAMAPNGRDYYTATNPNEAWKQALAQHADREKQLNYLIDSITSEIEAIQA